MTRLKKVATNHWRLLDSYEYKVLRSLQVAPKERSGAVLRITEAVVNGVK